VSKLLEQYKVSLQTRMGMQYTRFIFASHPAIALDELLIQTGTKTTQIDRNPDNSYMVWCDATGVKAKVKEGTAS
jgi:hypothetical protein